jgi:hypothetical protein
MIQFLIPALIVVGVVYLLARTKRGQDEALHDRTDDSPESSDTGTFILILVVGATVAVLSFFLLQALLG